MHKMLNFGSDWPQQHKTTLDATPHSTTGPTWYKKGIPHTVAGEDI